MSALQKAADVVHRTAVLGLVGYAVYGTVSVASQMLHGPTNKDDVHPQAGYLDTLKKKVAEEYSKYYKIDHRDWYDKDDDSYLKDVPRPNRPIKKQDEPKN